MKAINITVTAFAIILLTACGTSSAPSQKNETVESKSFDYKAPPKKEQALEVPPDLTSYTADDRYGIAGDEVSGTSFSDYSQGGLNRKQASVLPPARNVRLERSGQQRWLVVNDQAENIWPIVKAFWEENGLAIKIDNPQAGVIETEWAENRAKIPMDAFRKIVGKVLDGIFSNGERDQYHTRLERSKDGKSTEIYITHYGMQEVENRDGLGYRWMTRPNDPELEATMLQLLMSKLGGGTGLLDPSQKPATLAVADGTKAPKLNKLADGKQTILLSEPFDKSWRKVGLALEKAGIALADKDRSKGIYFLRDGAKVEKGGVNEKTIRNQVNVKEIASGCEVSVDNGTGSSNADTVKISGALFKALSSL